MIINFESKRLNSLLIHNNGVYFLCPMKLIMQVAPWDDHMINQSQHIAVEFY